MAGPDLSAVTTAIDFSTALEAVLFVAAALVSVHVVWVGAKKVLEAVRGGGSAVKVGNYSDHLRGEWDSFFGEQPMSREAAEFTMHRARLRGIDEHQLRGIAKRAAKEGRWS